MENEYIGVLFLGNSFDTILYKQNPTNTKYVLTGFMTLSYNE